MRTRTIFKVIYIDPADENNWLYKTFKTKEEAMEWGKKRLPNAYFQIDRYEEEFQEPPKGKNWVNEEYGWSYGESKITTIYDGNSEFKFEEKEGPQ